MLLVDAYASDRVHIYNFTSQFERVLMQLSQSLNKFVKYTCSFSSVIEAQSGS